jgi:hypothetical protein
VARALPALEALAAGRGSASSFARRAVLLLRNDDPAAAAVAQDLASTSMFERLAAVEALARHGGALARQGLDGALDDTDPTVRRQAAQRLIEVLGLGPLTRAADGDSEPVAPLEQLCWLMSAELPALHQHGAGEIRRIAAALAAGQTPAQLDLVYRPGPDPAFRLDLGDVLGEPGAEIPIDAIRRAGDHEQRFAETVLALRLQASVRDPRAPAALATLGADWTIPAIAQSAAGLPPSDAFARATMDALDQLRA